MLLERKPALDALAQALADATRSSGRVVLIGGEAGIGKTTLLRAFAQQAGMPLLWGACDPLFTPRPLAPLHDLAAALGADVAAALASDAGRAKVFTATLDALGRVPHALVFEDLHWADEATLDLLAYLGRRIGSTRTLLLASYRDDEIGATHPLRRVLGLLPGALRVVLLPLSARAVAQLAAGSAADAAALHRASGGNPFLVTELLAVGDAATLPPTVRDAVLARAALLPLHAREALDVAALIGPRIEPALVDSLAGTTASALDACLAAGVLRDAGADLLEFRHELARQAVLQAIAAPRRLALHRRALAALRARPGSDLARLAHHAEAAQDRDAVLAFAPAAARQALAVGARRQAHDQYARALRFADGLPAAEHAQLFEAFALECLAVGTASAGIAARERSIALRGQLGQVAAQAESLCRLSNLFVDVARIAEADAALQRAFALLSGFAPCRETAYVWRTQAHLSMLRGEDERAIDAARQAIELGERFGDVETVISALNSQGMSTVRSDFEAGWALLERSREMARAAGRFSQVFNADINLGEGATEYLRLDRAETQLRSAIAVANDLQMDATIPEGTLALCRLHQGRWDEAADLATRVLAACPEQRASRILAQVVLGLVRARRGDAGVWHALDEALPPALASKQLIYVASVRAARAEAAWLEGDLARCGDEARSGHEVAAHHRHAWFVGELAWWRQSAGETLAIAACEAAPYAAQRAGHWREAAQAWQALQMPYQRACALAHGDAAAQREALASFVDLGARPAADALREALRKAGVRGVARGARASTRSHPGGLTRAELKVLALLAEGLHNSDIALRLHRSVRTVDHHVAAVLAKLEVASRLDAVRRAEREGWLADR